MKVIRILLPAIVAGTLLQSCSGNKGTSDAYGNFESTEITCSAESQGRILFFHCEEGQIVKAGDTLGLIDTTDFFLKREGLLAQRNSLVLKQSGFQAQIDVQEQQKTNMIIEQKRLESLFKEKAATRKQMDDMDGNLKVIDKQLQTTRVQEKSLDGELQNLDRQVQLLRVSLGRCWIVSPSQGTILNRFAEGGELASPGKPLYKLADLTTMYLRVYISGDQLSKVKLGQAVDVFIDKDKTKNTMLKGGVSWISPSAEFTPKIIQTKEERVNMVYAVKVSVANDGSIKINMPGEVNFKE
ncbi:MAG: HlyD family efflux transporter periplasmic adaptor subunit [Bacteroidota bacterium]